MSKKKKKKNGERISQEYFIKLPVLGDEIKLWMNEIVNFLTVFFVN